MLTMHEFTAEDARKIGNQISGLKNFGPLAIYYDLDLSVPQITGKVTLYGISIGTFALNPQNTTTNISGHVGMAMAMAGLTANFFTNEVDYAVDVEMLGHTVYAGSGKIFSW